MRLKITIFMVIIGLVVLACINAFSDYYATWVCEGNIKKEVFGQTFTIGFIADTIFTLANILQIFLIILIMIYIAPNLKTMIFMVVLGIVVIICLHLFHLYYLAWVYSENPNANAFGVVVSLGFVSNLVFVIAIGLQVILIFLIFIEGIRL